MDSTRDKIGLIAGSGEVPIYFARKASQMGMKIISVGFSDDIQNGLAPFSEKSYSIGVGQAGKILSTFTECEIFLIVNVSVAPLPFLWITSPLKDCVLCLFPSLIV